MKKNDSPCDEMGIKITLSGYIVLSALVRMIAEGL